MLLLLRRKSQNICLIDIVNIEFQNREGTFWIVVHIIFITLSFIQYLHETKLTVGGLYSGLTLTNEGIVVNCDSHFALHF